RGHLTARPLSIQFSYSVIRYGILPVSSCVLLELRYEIVPICSFSIPLSRARYLTRSITVFSPEKFPIHGKIRSPARPSQLTRRPGSTEKQCCVSVLMLPTRNTQHAAFQSRGR